MQIRHKSHPGPQPEELPPHYFELFETIQSAAFIKDSRGRYAACNRAFEAFIRLPKDAIIGKTAAEIYPRIVAERVIAEDRQITETRKRGQFPVIYKSIDGQFLDAQVTKIPLPDSHGEVSGILGVFDNGSQNKLINEILVRYELLLRHSGDFIWILDPRTGRILEVNEASCKAYGYTRKEFQKLTLYDLRLDDPGTVDSQLAEAFKKGVLFETVHRRKDGTAFHVQINASSAVVGGREILISIIRDISEIVAAREALRQQNDRLALLHQTALALINRLDVDELFEQIVERASALTGFEHSFIFVLDNDGRSFSLKVGRGYCIKHLGGKFAADAGLCAKVVATRAPVLVNDYKAWEGHHDDPRLEKVQGVMAAPLLAAGRVVGLIGFVALDRQTNFTAADLAITAEFANLASLVLNNAKLYAAARTEIQERRRAEEEIRKLSQAVDQSPSLVIITDTDSRITYVNAKFTHVYGYTLDEIRGMTPQVLKSGLQDDDFYRGLWDTVRADREWKGELCNRKKNGELIWVLASVSAVRNLEGNIAYLLAVQQDITEQKNLEATLQRQNLEIQNTLATLRQTQARLIQNEKMAGIGQLAAGVAHEINNPLGFVLSNFGTMQKYMVRLVDIIKAYRGLHDLVGREQRTEILEACQAIDDLEKKYRLDYIINDLDPIFSETGEGIGRVEKIIKALRLFSRADLQDSYHDYDLNAGIGNTLTVARNELKYVADVEEDLGDIPIIQAVGGKINQVLLNLLLNAAQAVKKSHSGRDGRIKISSRADDRYVYCVIEDNGPGIPDEIRQDIFNPFFTTKPVGEGTGLGLSISYDIIINKHHGDILLDSKPNEGASFTIKLPIRQPEPPQ
jgi:PAS domain S-box-containing protein